MTKLATSAKETAGMSFWILLGAIALLAVWLIAVYNGLVGGRNQAQAAWSQIDVQLKRRHDLIPNLVQVVKDAMGYEQETLTKVIQARNAAVAASGPAQAGPAEANLTLATRGLLGLVESYPQLKANDNIMQLQEELTGTENKIAFARQFYNDSVASYNTRRESFPAVLAAASLGFGPMELFNMPEAEKEVPRIALR
jgi:LemA protein